MSAYIVEDKTVNRVIASLVCDAQREFKWYFDRIMRAAQIDQVDEDWTTKLGISMSQMNDAAMDARYGTSTASGDRQGEQYEYHIAPPDTLYQVHKSLSCFLYQCSEGDVPECELYKALTEYKHAIAEHILGRLPAYEKAEWA